MKPIYLVAGARPNFIKLAPLVWELRLQGQIPFEIIHTGQHYDEAMSQSFFRVLELPSPEYNLEVGPESINQQTARILERFDRLLAERPPAGVVVFGDVTSTLACALAAARHHIPLAHVEAGLRSFDARMPEELNRRLTDSLAGLLLVTEASAVENLRREGMSPDSMHLVGNIMIDTLERMLPLASQRTTLERLGLREGGYALLTLHRPANVDDSAVLKRLLDLFQRLSDKLPFVFPIHPRTRQKILDFRLERAAVSQNGRFHIIPPLDYLDSIQLQRSARMVITDSGGMQEETSYLGVPCLTLRPVTERPITLSLGTSVLVGSDPERIADAFSTVLDGSHRPGVPIPFWDGHTAKRILPLLKNYMYGEV